MGQMDGILEDFDYGLGWDGIGFDGKLMVGRGEHCVWGSRDTDGCDGTFDVVCRGQG